MHTDRKIKGNRQEFVNNDHKNRIFSLIVMAVTKVCNVSEKNKSAFYKSLNATIRTVPRKDIRIILGDFNARICHDHHVWQGTFSKQGIGNRNANGLLHFVLYAENDLTDTNTRFPLLTSHKTNLLLLLIKHWHILDYVLTTTQYKRSPGHYQTLMISGPITGLWSLVSDFLSIHPVGIPIIKSAKRETTVANWRIHDLPKSPKKLLNNIWKEKQNGTTSPNEWNTLRESTMSSADEGVDNSKRQTQDFAENIKDIEHLIKKNRSTYCFRESSDENTEKCLEQETQIVQRCFR